MCRDGEMENVANAICRVSLLPKAFTPLILSLKAVIARSHVSQSKSSPIT